MQESPNVHQFNRERVVMILERPASRARLQTMLDEIAAASSECFVPPTRFTAVRVGGGEKERSTNRALVWKLSGRELPVGGFEAPSCGTKSCINPAHQKTRDIGEA